MMSSSSTITQGDELNRTSVHPIEILKELATSWNLNISSQEFAIKLNESNLWPTYRDRFEYPKLRELPKVDLSLVENPDEDCIYFCGNSLGLLPKASRQRVISQFDKWAKMGVYGHEDGDMPWAWCEESCRPLMAKLVGGLVDEVNIMNFLTVNLHIMMITFYQPTEKRYKILLEDKAFPSDHYAVESQIKLHNLDPEQCMVLIKPREGEAYFRTEDIIKRIEEEGDTISLVLLSGIQYYTGQLFKIKEITEAAHRKGCIIGWDLAHAVGNVELNLHDWNVDFAVWCTYKYLNSGAGGIGGVFLHEKHFNMENKRKLDGWWGHRLDTRFKMTNKMEYAKGVAAYSLSNVSILLSSALMGSLEVFEEAGMQKLRNKSKILTGYMEFLLNERFKSESNTNRNSLFEILTPIDPEQRGSQLSLKFHKSARNMHVELEKLGIVCDYREPGVLRFAPNALYNTFVDVYRFVEALEKFSKKSSE